jgi:hypothetical protein
MLPSDSCQDEAEEHASHFQAFQKIITPFHTVTSEVILDGPQQVFFKCSEPYSYVNEYQL